MPAVESTHRPRQHRGFRWCRDAKALQGGQSCRGLGQCKRVAPGQPVQVGRDSCGDVVGRQECDRAVKVQRRQPHDVDVVQPTRRTRGKYLTGSHRKDGAHPVCVQPSKGEQQRARTRLIHPLQVVDQHHHRTAFSGSRQDPEEGNPDQERVTPGAGLHAEHHPQRFCLWPGQLLHHVEERSKNTEESRKGDVLRPRYADGSEHHHLRGATLRQVQQRRLPRSSVSLDE